MTYLQWRSACLTPGTLMTSAAADVINHNGRCLKITLFVLMRNLCILYRVLIKARWLYCLPASDSIFISCHEKYLSAFARQKGFLLPGLSILLLCKQAWYIQYMSFQPINCLLQLLWIIWAPPKEITPGCISTCLIDMNIHRNTELGKPWMWYLACCIVSTALFNQYNVYYSSNCVSVRIFV